MTKQLLWILFAIVAVPLVEYLLGLQLLQLGAIVRGDLDFSSFGIDLNLGHYFISDLNREVFWVVTGLVFLSILYILWVNIIRLRWGERSGLKDKDGNPVNEDDIRHQASTWEAKKGTLRIDFGKDGEVNPKSWRFKVDQFFNPFKKAYNKVAKKLFGASDRSLLNTIKYYPNINAEDGKMTRFKSGIPIVFKKNRVYVDAGDNHCLIIGTTNSGKTFSYIDPMIELARMCGESMVINDVKGELYKSHAKTLEKSGYKVISINFIEPKTSDRWNPLGTIIKKYRQAYYDNQTLIQQKHMKETTELYNILRELNFLKKQNKDLTDELNKVLPSKGKYSKHQPATTTYSPENSIKVDEIKAKQKILEQKIYDLRKRKRELNDIIPKPNYSDAAELVADIANALCHEDAPKDPYWSTSAMQLLEAYIYFLLEERVMTDKGYSDFMPVELVNMFSVKMLHQQGMEKVTVDKKEITLLEYYLNNYRKSTDNSVKSMSVFLNAPEQTRGSIASMLETKIRWFLLNTDVLNMTAVSSFDLEDLANQKTALFIGVHDEKSTFHPLTTILISQIYEELIKESRKHPKDLRLPIPINIYWDEFANGASYPNIDNALTAGRSRGIRFYLLIQGIGQLENLYGMDKTKTIIDNCVDFVYILAQDNSTINRVSTMCGHRIVYSGKSRQTVPVFSDERLRMLSLGESITIRQRMNPYLTRSKGLPGFKFYRWYKENKAEPREINTDIKQARYFDIADAIIRRDEESNISIDAVKIEQVEGLRNDEVYISVSPQELARDYDRLGPASEKMYAFKGTGEVFKKVEGGQLTPLAHIKDDEQVDVVPDEAFADE